MLRNSPQSRESGGGFSDRHPPIHVAQIPMYSSMVNLMLSARSHSVAISFHGRSIKFAFLEIDKMIFSILAFCMNKAVPSSCSLRNRLLRILGDKPFVSGLRKVN